MFLLKVTGIKDGGSGFWIDGDDLVNWEGIYEDRGDNIKIVGEKLTGYVLMCKENDDSWDIVEVYDDKSDADRAINERQGIESYIFKLVELGVR